MAHRTSRLLAALAFSVSGAASGTFTLTASAPRNARLGRAVATARIGGSTTTAATAVAWRTWAIGAPRVW